MIFYDFDFTVSFILKGMILSDSDMPITAAAVSFAVHLKSLTAVLFDSDDVPKTAYSFDFFRLYIQTTTKAEWKYSQRFPLDKPIRCA